MNKLLLLVFAIFSYSNIVAQVEVCETEEDYVIDVNSINKCVIDHRVSSKNQDAKIKRNTLVLTRRIIEKRNLNKVEKVSKELIDKLIIRDKINSETSNQDKTNSN